MYIPYFYDDALTGNREIHSFKHNFILKSLQTRNVTGISGPSIAEFHVLYMYFVFWEVYIGAEICHPHPNCAELGMHYSYRSFQFCMKSLAEFICKIRYKILILSPFDLKQVPAMLDENIHGPK